MDLVDIHSYGNLATFQSDLPKALKHALEARKYTMVEEFGSLGANKSEDIEHYIDYFNKLGVPWQPWEISKPGFGPSDYEFWVDEPTYRVVWEGGREASSSEAAQDFHHLE